MSIKNPEMASYQFLQEMYKDGYFPNFLVDKGKDILVRLCESIELNKPESLDSLYELTRVATEEFNVLGEEFEQNDSEIETVARESIGDDFYNISKAYGFDADIEELIAARYW
ncbi:DUF5713 family protein [Vibrio anguillarum]|uniref:DUF5713 family protein n=1 Tax=Vibrio anguillarum TaxID=55601 RepID=UPI001C9CB8F3|nr:DUF5713 family protein [Vibrio anguillarum]MBY7668321.1 hypothetical protein [Vibrio anguillarum]